MLHKEKIHNLLIHKKRRRYLRNNATYAERVFWYYLNNSELGYKFRRQHGINRYIVDFYCPELKLIVELDGEAHNYIHQSNKDYIREKKLKTLGFTVIRYKNKYIIFELERVLNHLIKVCKFLEKRNNKI